MQLMSLLKLIANKMDKPLNLLDFSSIKTRKIDPKYSSANVIKLSEKYNVIDDLDIVDGIKDYLIFFQNQVN